MQWLTERLFASQAARRLDLIEDACQRLAMVAPDHPEVLVMQMQEALDNMDLQQEKLLLAQVADSGDMDLLHRLKTLVRIRRADGQLALQQARLFASAGRFEEAAGHYQTLFGNQPPTFELALEYWKLMTDMPARRAEALGQLYRLNEQYPGNGELQLLLGRVLFDTGRNSEALQVLHTVVPGATGEREKAAEMEYNQLIREPVSADSATALRSFLQRYPQSTFAVAAKKNLAAQEKLLASADWRAGVQGHQLLAQQRYAAAEPLLRRAVRSYPEDGNLHGALAHTLLNLNRYDEAEHYFALAAEKIAKTASERSGEQDIPVIESEAGAWLSKWENLRLYNQSLIHIQRAERLQEQGNWQAARNALLQARRLQPGAVTSYIRLHELELSRGNEPAALEWLQQVRKAHPHDDRVVYAVTGYYRERDPQQALRYLDELPLQLKKQFASLRIRLQLEQLERDIEQALARGDRAQAIALRQRAFAYSPDDPWLAYRLGALLLEEQRQPEAEKVFETLLGKSGSQAATRYAHGLYLASQERDHEVLQTLEGIPQPDWTDDMRALDERVRQRLRERQAMQLWADGQHQEAFRLLLQQAEARHYVTAAGWAEELGLAGQAKAYYREALKLDPEHLSSRVHLAGLYLAEGRHGEARGLLQASHPAPDAEPYLVRRMAEYWTGLGDETRAIELYENILEHSGDDAQSLRNLARLYRDVDPDRALDLYARGLAASGELGGKALQPLDLPSLTYATRLKDDDDWLVRSLKADTEDLYQQRNTRVQIQQDFGWRSDSDARGLSDLKRHTTIARLDTPLAGGNGFALLEQVRLRSARPGSYRFGLCSKTLGGCRPGSQDAEGAGFALGWQGEQWSWDLGHSPFGFRQDNWLGGITYHNRQHLLGYDLTLSRRPMSNSIVSYAGARDPVSRTSWGGVTANGLTLGLSLDQGGNGGVWASLGAHRLSGKRVQDNRRWTAMTGYYHRLIDRVDERMRVGLTLMGWRYDKGMDEFTLGQGGYYSPQKYASISVPFSYAWRNYDWSLVFESSVGWSTSSYAGGDRLYLSDSDQRILGAGHEPDAAVALRNSSSSSSGLGVRSQFRGERRLTDHWVLGAGIDWGYSKDYSPSHAFLYLRYMFQPWRGNLALPVEPLVPYADWK